MIVMICPKLDHATLKKPWTKLTVIFFGDALSGTHLSHDDHREATETGIILREPNRVVLGKVIDFAQEV